MCICSNLIKMHAAHQPHRRHVHGVALAELQSEPALPQPPARPTRRPPPARKPQPACRRSARRGPGRPGTPPLGRGRCPRSYRPRRAGPRRRRPSRGSGCHQRHSATAVSRPFLPQISPIFRHFSPVLSVSAPGSRTAQRNGGKTAQNGRKTAEKQWAGWRWVTCWWGSRGTCASGRARSAGPPRGRACPGPRSL